jgi:hypothetical protein
MKTKTLLILMTFIGMAGVSLAQVDSIYYSFAIPSENTLSYSNLSSKFKEGKWILTNKSDLYMRSILAMEEHYKRNEKTSIEVKALMEPVELTRNSKYGFDLNMLTRGAIEGDSKADGYVVRFMVQKSERRFYIDEYYLDYSKDGKINNEVAPASVRPDGEINFMETDIKLVEKTERFKDAGSDLIGMERIDGKIFFYINGYEVYNIPDKEAGSYTRSVYINLAPNEKLKVDNLTFKFNNPSKGQ